MESSPGMFLDLHVISIRVFICIYTVHVITMYLSIFDIACTACSEITVWLTTTYQSAV